jgi:hypothetical protein
MGMTPEGKVKKAVKSYLKDIGAWYYMPVSNGMGRVGCPDILACYNGMFIAIETKAPGKRASVTPNQQREIADIQTANGLALVVDDVEQVKEALNAQIIPAGTAHQGGVQQAP